LYRPGKLLVNKLGIEIRIAQYPPYTSKYNPIEHRLCPHLTRVCQGVMFETVEIVRELMSKATIKTGLTGFANILDQVYPTGRQVTEDFKQNMQIVFDEYLPHWNYTAIPQSA
jgi:Rhodopirellula transposase DDE domain